MPAMTKKIRVLIVDDSAVVRQTLEEVLSSDREIEVMATASDPYIAAEKIAREVPDVITLDVEMPRMDGLTFLHKIMIQHPMPVVICSSLTDEGSETAMKALEYGAVEIITKPKLGAKQFLEESKIRICDAVKAAAQAKLHKLAVLNRDLPPKLTADVILPKPRPGSDAMLKTTEKVVVVGASTGGTEALCDFLQAMPLDAPGIVIVQHMPENFTRAFANRLDGSARYRSRKRRTTIRSSAGGRSSPRATAICCSSGAARAIMWRSRTARWYHATVRRWTCCSAPRRAMPARTASASS